MKKIYIIIIIFIFSYIIINYSSEIKVKEDWITYYCHKYNLDKNLIKAIIIYESNDNQYEKNRHSSAYGKGQFILSTGEWVAKNLKYDNYNHYETTEQQQIEMICWYINYLKNKYNGNERNILLEYSGNCEGDLYVKRVMKIKKEIYKNEFYIKGE